MIKVLVFDLDGTLVDSDDVIINTWLELFKDFKDKDFHLDIEEIRTFSGPPLRETIKRIFPEYDTDFILKEYDKRTGKYYDSCLSVFSDVEETLNKFKHDGYKLAILTSKNKEMVLRSLRLTNLSNGIFEFVVTSDDVIHHKPDPEGLLKIMEFFSVKNDEIINIGDTDFDYECGQNAHVKTIMMTMKNRKYKNKLIPLAFANSYNELYKEIKNYDHN